MRRRMRWRWLPPARDSGQAMPRFIVATALLALGLVMLAMAVSAYAIWTESTSVTPNDFVSDTLDPPSGLGATGGASVDLNWTATDDDYASGHRVLRGTDTGGPYSQIAEVTPRMTTTYPDSPADGTYYYVLRAFYQSWESVNSNEASATVSTAVNTGFLSPGAQAAVTSGSGDKDGFEVTPTNAFDNDGAFAGDTNSGTTSSTGCGDTSKDRHLFYDYGFSIPAGSTINGIEVRLDAWADKTNPGAPFMCVELSWDSGTTWTAVPKTTPDLGKNEATFPLGSASDTWDRTWSDTEFTNVNFRVRVTNVSGNNGRDFFLDWVPVQVTYTPP